MPKPLDVVAFLSSVAMMSRKAETYPPDTQVIDLAELRQIIFETQQETEKEASWGRCCEVKRAAMEVSMWKRSWPPSPLLYRNQAKRRPMSGAIRRRP